MMHPATELRFISDEIGFGVVARQPISRGTITWIADELDQRFTREQVARLHPISREAVLRFSYTGPAGQLVLCWDHGRYVNHSCDPNCLSAGFQFEFAIRDIAQGEQLTDDYGQLNLEEPLDCCCGFPGCRTIIRPDDVVNYMGYWDELVRSAFPFIERVDQPLWPLLENAGELEMIFRGVCPIPSCALHQWQRP